MVMSFSLADAVRSKCSPHGEMADGSLCSRSAAHAHWPQPLPGIRNQTTKRAFVSSVTHCNLLVLWSGTWCEYVTGSLLMMEKSRYWCFLARRATSACRCRRGTLKVAKIKPLVTQESIAYRPSSTRKLLVRIDFGALKCSDSCSAARFGVREVGRLCKDSRK